MLGKHFRGSLLKYHLKTINHSNLKQPNMHKPTQGK